MGRLGSAFPTEGARMNNGKSDERGLLGQFSTSTYITLADPYMKKGTMLSRYKKKQFQTNPARKGRVKEALFGKAFPFLADGDKFNDKTTYLKTQPRETRKKGFLSSDAFKADEFSNTLRTNQYRWALGREAAIPKMQQEKNKEREAQRAQTAPPGRRAEVIKAQELGKLEPALETPNLGDWVPSSYEIGNEMVQEHDLQKPTYASTPIVRSTFYRVGNLKANSGWAALPGTAH